MASAPTANEIKTQLKTLLTPVIGTSGTKKAKILDYLGLAFKPGEGEDATILRSPLDIATLDGGGTVQRINCLMISEGGFTQPQQPRETGRTDDSPRPSRHIIRQFRLTYFYQFGDSSENTFSTNVEAIRLTIQNEPHLGFAMVTGGLAGKGAYVEVHEELQMPFMLPDAFGDTIVHVADGTLTVRVTKTGAR